MERLNIEGCHGANERVNKVAMDVYVSTKEGIGGGHADGACMRSVRVRGHERRKQLALVSIFRLGSMRPMNGDR